MRNSIDEVPAPALRLMRGLRCIFVSSEDYIFWGLSEVCGAGGGGVESHAGRVVQIHQVRGKAAPVVGERAV